MKTIDADIKNNEFKRVYLLYGEESWLVRRYKNRLKEALSVEGDTMNINFFSGSDASDGAIIDLSETMPFFADYRVIMCEDTGFFKAGRKSLEGDDGEGGGSHGELAEYIKDIPETTVIVFTENDVDKRSRLYKAVTKYGHAAEFAKQTPEVISNWVLGLIKKEGKRITGNALNEFTLRVGDDMGLIEHELEKLLSYCADKEDITIEDVDAVVERQLSDKVFDMIDAILDKQNKKALLYYHDMLSLKEPPFKIFYLIVRQYNILYRVKTSSPGSSALAGLHPFVVKKSSRQASKLSTDAIKQILAYSADLEERAKTGLLTDQLALDLLITRVQNN
ncbi:MAG: DNA polymerase III subunit delta [Lachnospiraceae bacterium]|nr:DNA polymerase III subunit delta [Lachnospiraceae bacterium]